MSNSSGSRSFGLVAFVVISFVGGWLAMLPLWIDGFRRTNASPGETPTFASICMLLMMFVPALTAMGLTLHSRGWSDAAQSLGLRRALPLRAEARYALVGIAIPLALTTMGLIVATWVGWYNPSQVPPPTAVVGLLMSAAVSVPLYFGEELGWQGYLLPRLLRLGRVRGVLLCGAIWGLWHVPMTALGGSYPGHPVWQAIPAAVVTATLLGTVIATVRLYSGSVWAAVATHLSLNEFALPLTTLSTSGTVDPLLAGPLAISTWPTTAAVAICAGLSVLRNSRTPQPSDAS